jgi:acyl dehydratase
VSHWDLEALQERIGREVVYRAPEPIGAAAARYFAIAIGSSNPCYTDADVARANGHRDVVVPPTWLCETNQYVAEAQTDEHGYRGHQWDLPIRGCRQVRGGNRYRFHRHAHPDDVVTATWRITSVEERTSRDGRPMLVVGSEARYCGTDGDPIVDDHETLIFQPLPGAG